MGRGGLPGAWLVVPINGSSWRDWGQAAGVGNRVALGGDVGLGECMAVLGVIFREDHAAALTGVGAACGGGGEGGGVSVVV